MKLNRRTVLRGAGASLALPIFECMMDDHGEAFADGSALPIRFVVFFWGNGILREKFQPAQTGSAWQLSETMAPLAKVKDYLNVLTGYDIKTPNRNGHHNGTAGILSGYPYVGGKGANPGMNNRFGGPSIDQVVAAKLASKTAYPSIELAISRRVQKGEGPSTQYISHKSTNEPLPPIFSPRELYNKLFSGYQFPIPASQYLKESSTINDLRRRSILDLVLSGSKRLRAKLGYHDQQRLDSHMNAISEIRQRLNNAESQNKEASNPSVSCDLIDPVSDDNKQEDHSTVNSLMAELLSIAFACDLTRVASIQFCGSFANPVFREAGLSSGSHDISHASDASNVIKATTFIMQNFANLLETMKNTSDGNGNLLDKACVFGCTEISNGIRDDHGVRDHSIVLAGKAGGRLKYPGIHHKSQGGNASDVLLTAAQAVDKSITEIGGESGKSSTACQEVKA